MGVIDGFGFDQEQADNVDGYALAQNVLSMGRVTSIYGEVHSSHPKDIMVTLTFHMTVEQFDFAVEHSQRGD